MKEIIKMNLVSGHEFMKLADVCICMKNFDEKLKLDVKNIFSIDKVDKKKLEDSGIIFVKTDYIKIFLHRYYKYLKEEIILITHNSDFCIEYDMISCLDLPKIKRWYGQNTKIIHPKLVSIPLGIANPQYPHGNKKLIKEIRDKNFVKENLLYINFTINTNQSARKRVYDLFKNRPNDCGKNLSQENYLENLAKSRFCISPPGNGIDCHRVWECIYLNTIPIVEKDIAFEQFKELPILFIDKWEDINDNFLLKEYNNIVSKNKDKCYVEFWKKHVNN